MPASPSRAETSPSCMTPVPESVGSSSCSAIMPPHSRWYCSALRRMPGAVDRLAVVGEPERAGLAQLGHLGQRLARQAARDEARKPTGMRASRRAASRSERRTGARVDRRVGVRHRDDGDEAAGGGGARAGVEVLLVLLAGRAQVHVRVDEAREQVPALAVDDLAPSARPASGAPMLGDLAAADEHVERRVEPVARVEHVGAADQDVGGRRSAGGRAVRRAPGPWRAAGRAARVAAGEQLVEDGHPDDDAGRDLLADHAPAASRSPRRRARRRG